MKTVSFLELCLRIEMWAGLWNESLEAGLHSNWKRWLNSNLGGSEPQSWRVREVFVSFSWGFHRWTWCFGPLLLVISCHRFPKQGSLVIPSFYPSFLGAIREFFGVPSSCRGKKYPPVFGKIELFRYLNTWLGKSATRPQGGEHRNPGKVGRTRCFQGSFALWKHLRTMPRAWILT